MQQKKIKLAVFDLDGTLLNSDDTMEEETVRALQMLDRARVTIMINSGRVPSMAAAYLAEAGVCGILSCANGAYIKDAGGNVIHRNVISADIVKRVTKRLTEEKVSFSLMTEKDICVSQVEGIPKNRFDQYEALAKRHGLPFPHLLRGIPEKDLAHTPVYKIPVLEFEEDKIQDRLRFLRGLSSGIEVTRSGARILDVTAAGVSKGAAVRIVAEHLGLQREEICCMGDYDNDISMFREAGLSVAMGNASGHVKAAADYVTEDHDRNGAAEAIRRFVLPRTEG